MALANFFDRSAFAVLQVLQGLDHASLAAALEEHVVGLYFDDAAVVSPEGKRTLELTVNLLARLYPRLVLLPEGTLAEKATTELIANAHAINPEIEIGANSSNATIILAAGETRSKAGVPVVYMGSDGWVARISSSEPIGSGNSLNPFGAGAAACFGAANVFRILFAAHLTEGRADDKILLSLIDYEPSITAPSNADLGPVDLGDSYLVGLGAIGNAAVWALSRTPQLSGSLHLIDGEAIELSNLQRYVLTTQANDKCSKVALAAEQFAGTSVTAIPHPLRWGEFLRGVSPWSFERVAVGVDSAEDRQAIQASLPRWIINAWTQPGDLGVSRHEFLGENACLMCLYLPDEAGKNLDRIIADALRLPEALMEIRTLLHNNAPIGRDLLGRAATAMGVPIEPLLPFENEPIRSFYVRAVCGGVVLQLGGTVGGGDNQLAAVPLAFQSALAGIMLAAELVIHAGGLRGSAFPVTTKLDLLRPLKDYLSLPLKKHRSGYCICQDVDYVNAYLAKYGTN